MQTTAKAYRLLGLTKDHTECDRCGRVDLKRTAMVQWLDEDGNEDGPVAFYGTTCVEHVMREAGHDVCGEEIMERAKREQRRADEREQNRARMSGIEYGRACAVAALRSWNAWNAGGVLRGTKVALVYRTECGAYNSAPVCQLENNPGGYVARNWEEKAQYLPTGDVRFLGRGGQPSRENWHRFTPVAL